MGPSWADGLMNVNPAAQERYEAGDAARSAGDLERASEAYRQAVAVDPAHANAIYRLGELALANGDREQAESLFRRALSVHPGHAWARKRLEAMATRQAPPRENSARTTDVPPLAPYGTGLVGVVESVRRSQEAFAVRSGHQPVLSVRVRAKGGEWDSRLIAAELRGKNIRGVVDAHDWVEFPAGWRPGARLKSFRNLTTGGEVKVVQSTVAEFATWAVVAFVTIWIAVIFIVVGRELFF